MREPVSENDSGLLELAEEFVARYRNGERPSVAEYIEKYPQFADRIRQLFPAVAVMEQCKPIHEKGAAKTSSAAADDLAVPRRLGEYRILREIARGGMGIVYEAVQESLGRHVALKVLPAHGLLSPVHLERFRREARAAARLHHSNIVPVFGVGECEGVHYYAMQFIRGQSLACVLDELRRLRSTTDGSTVDRHGLGLSVRNPQSHSSGEFTTRIQAGSGAQPPVIANLTSSRTAPDYQSTNKLAPAANQSSTFGSQSDEQYFRSVAQLGAQVADALVYAHQQGVLHRDIKPSNLLLDLQGTVWVSDFGLAKLEEADELTHTGDIVGTLRYMPPERFDGRSDPRSDIYSLGITLYELLTLQPAFQNSRREQLVERVLREEPVRPRALDRQIPQDLETIVLKAAAKDPNDRYANASLLAEDLRHFLSDRPIQARRSGNTERAWRWCRRNPALAAMSSCAAALLLTALVVLAVSNVWITNERNEKDQALKDKLLALEAAQGSAQIARKQQELANVHASQAEMQRELAVSNLYQSLVREVQSLRAARGEGYRIQAFKRLQQALQLETSEKNLSSLRQEAVACLGDFVGLQPVIWSGFPSDISSVALDPDGNLIAIGCVDGTAIMRKLHGEQQLLAPNHDSPVSSLTFNHDGTKLVSLDRQGTVKLWHRTARDDWQCYRTFATATPKIDWDHQLQFTAIHRDRCFSISAGSSTIVQWSLDDDGAIEELRAPGSEVLHCLALSPDGRLLAAGYHLGRNHRGVLVWDTTSRQTVPTVLSTLDYPRQLSFSPDGRMLASAAKDGGVVVWDTADFQRRFFVGGDNPDGVAFSPDNQFIAIRADESGTVRLWHVSSNREIAVLRHPNGPHTMAFSGDGATFVTANLHDIRIWNLAGGGEKRVLAGHQGGVPGLTFSPDGTLLASAGKDCSVKIWDPNTGELLKTLDGFGDRVATVAFSPNGQLLGAGDWADTIKIWDVHSWQVAAVLEREVGGEIWAVAFSPDGQYFAAGADDGGVFLWRIAVHPASGADSTRATLERVVHITDRPTLGLCFSPDSTRIAWSEWPGPNVHFWEVNESRELPEPRSLFERAFGMPVFRPDSQHVIVNGPSHYPEIWNIVRGERVFTLEPDSFDTTQDLRASGGIAATDDGSWLAQGGAAIRVWDVAGRKLLFALPEERSQPWSFAWSPDKRLLAVGSSDGGLVLWNVSKIRQELAVIGLDWTDSSGLDGPAPQSP